MVNIDYHHNMITNTGHRNPLLRGQSSRLVNNIFYNQGSYINHISGQDADIIGNIYRRGPNTNTRHEVQVSVGNAPGPPSVFMLGNLGFNQPNPAGDQWVMANETGDENQGAETGPVRASWRRSSPMAGPARPITAEPVANIEASVLPIVGASRRLDCEGNWVTVRDSQDARIVNQYTTGTGPTNTVQGPETGYPGAFYPVISVGTPCPDSDLDGMPNAWESARPGLSNSNAADRNGDLDGDGYLNLEEYLAGPDGTPPPAPSPRTGSGAITEAPAPGTGVGKVDVRGGPERRPFGRRTVQ